MNHLDIVAARTRFTDTFARRAGCSLRALSAQEAFVAEILGYSRSSSYGNVRLGHRHASEEAVEILREFLSRRKISRRNLNFACLLNPDATARQSARSRGGTKKRLVRMGLKDRTLVVLPPLGATVRVREIEFGGRKRIEIAVC